MSDAARDQNHVASALGVSSSDATVTLPFKVSPITGRLLTDASGGGSVTTVSVVTANGFAGSVANPTSAPAITISTTITGILQGNGTAISAITVGTGLNFSAGTLSAAASGLTVGTSPIASGTTTRILYDNAGVLGETTGITTDGTIATLTTPVINGLATGTGVTSSATASTIATRDASAYLIANNIKLAYVTTATAAGTTTLTNSSSSFYRYWTGSTTQTVVMPVTSTLLAGQSWLFTNKSSGAVTFQSSGANTIVVVAPGTSVLLTCILTTGTDAASWDYHYYSVLTDSGKSLSVTNSITLSGTDSTTMTFPSTTATIARTDAAQTFTGTQTFAQVITTANAIAASGNAATVPVTSRHNIVTNNSAATLTITLTTASAVNMQTVVVQILDFSAVAQTITWVNTENSTVTAPTTSNGSTSLPLTVGFMYNTSTSKWRCIASS